MSPFGNFYKMNFRKEAVLNRHVLDYKKVAGLNLHYHGSIMDKGNPIISKKPAIIEEI